MESPGSARAKTVLERLYGRIRRHSGARSQGRCRRPCQSRQSGRLSADREPATALPTTPSRSPVACSPSPASPSLYIADLDAIAGVGNHFELVPRAYLRASRHRTVDRCRLLRCRRLRLLAAARGDAGDRQRKSSRRRGLAGNSCGVRRERRAVARFRRRRPARPDALFGDAGALARRVIAMDLDRVGTDKVPTSTAQVAGRHGREAAPSLRPAACAMRAISKHRRVAGASGALLATALHRNAVTPK